MKSLWYPPALELGSGTDHSSGPTPECCPHRFVCRTLLSGRAAEPGSLRNGLRVVPVLAPGFDSSVRAAADPPNPLVDVGDRRLADSVDCGRRAGHAGLVSEYLDR